MSRAVLSLGSNVGDRLKLLQGAIDLLRPWIVAVSPVYETAPWGPVEQDDFLNAIAVVDDPDAKPQDWLDRAHACEIAAGRNREVRWGPRTLDVDVITVGSVIHTDPGLTLPHPHAGDRAFVLVPWAAVDPDALLAGRPVTAWLSDLPALEVAGVRRVSGTIS